tara:strand:- start:1051 stop:1695 length:645 start_codon:yes stop_codon:yes gene_type:complete
MPLKLFDQLVTQYLDQCGNLITDNTVASAGMAPTGGQGGGDYNDGDTYAPGDTRIPKVLGATIKRRGKVKTERKRRKKKLNESKTIYDYLLFPPEGEDQESIVDNISKLKSKPDEAYRGISSAEYKNLKRNGFVVSRGVGNTRKGIKGSYVSDDIQLAGRFAFYEYRKTKRGYLLILDRDKLPDLNPADEGNYWTEKIPEEAVKKAINLQDLTK